MTSTYIKYIVCLSVCLEHQGVEIIEETYLNYLDMLWQVLDSIV